MKLKGLLICLLTSLLIALPPLCGTASADSDDTAEDITRSTLITGTGYEELGFLSDGSTYTYKSSAATGAAIVLKNDKGIASVYIYFDLEYGEYTVINNDTGAKATAGKYGFLHELIDLKELFGESPTSVTLSFQNGSVRMSELYCFGEGERLPSHVQKWQPPLENGADILLFSTHSDDDQLFFAGLIPLYSGERKCRVQVVLMTDHRKGPYATNTRAHEVINGLWATGLKAYPVFGDFTDERIDSLEGMYAYYEKLGVSREELLDFVVTQIRRFKPLVTVTHDINGEYGHGMHRIYADLVMKAADITSDPESFPESAERYGVWDIQKIYLHLYSENKIVIDYDTPLKSFGGMSAFTVSQKLGFPCHNSQQGTWFKSWLNGVSGQITRVTEIATYNPAHFGLYRSTVGEDTLKNDFLENITTYAEREEIDRGEAKSVAELISSIGTVTLESNKKISEARAAYNALTDKQKALVDNLSVLDSAEATLALLIKDEADNNEQRGTVKAVIAVIAIVTAALLLLALCVFIGKRCTTGKRRRWRR